MSQKLCPLLLLGDSGVTVSCSCWAPYYKGEGPKELRGMSVPEAHNLLGKEQHARKPLSFLAMEATPDVCRGR